MDEDDHYRPAAAPCPPAGVVLREAFFWQEKWDLLLGPLASFKHYWLLLVLVLVLVLLVV